jgi:hypothetical protein
VQKKRWERQKVLDFSPVFVNFSQIPGGHMLKLFAFLLLLPLASHAGDSCASAVCDQVLKIRANHPKLEGLELELENGDVISLQEFLTRLSESDTHEVHMRGGEVPWPVTGEGGNKKERDPGQQ